MGAKHLLCTNTYDDSEKNHDANVVGCKEGDSTVLVKAEDPGADTTEQSSSYGDSFSGSDMGLKIMCSDFEVESPALSPNDHSHAFDGPDRLFKKKKVTPHWRKFISPLMWRCQWLELRMNELRSHASRYDKELAAYRHENQLHVKAIDQNDIARSVPLTPQRFKKPAMKRRKRRRNEDSINIFSYMANHNIFSYYENKKCETEGYSIDDDFSDQADDITRGNHDYLWALDFRDGDRSLEQILLNIEALQSRVLKIKTRLSQIISKNIRDAVLGCGLMGDQPVSSAQSPSCSLGYNRYQIRAGAPNTPAYHGEFEIDGMIVPGSAVSSSGDAPDLDIIESTLGFFAGADGPLNPNQLQEFCKDNSDDVLINNLAADEELQNFEAIRVREKLNEPKTIKEPNSDDESTGPAHAPAHGHVSMSSDPSDQGPERERLFTPQQPLCTGKRRGRKPKRRRCGGDSAADWKNERLQKKRRLSS
ncbi:hypothetical protein KSP40_PGU006828 [Platanthera guangdongensis]|uniref:Uncharacterized protein n=1 Tax=Platanthera guangdongensis TaxID=2320717 RepID=A0ABR2LCI4_9ASPA